MSAVFKLCWKMSHRYFLFVSMVTKTGFPAWAKWEYAVSLSDRKLVKRQCPVSSTAKPYLCKTTADGNNSQLKVLTSEITKSPCLNFENVFYRRLCSGQNIGAVVILPRLQQALPFIRDCPKWRIIRNRNGISGLVQKYSKAIYWIANKKKLQNGSIRGE